MTNAKTVARVERERERERERESCNLKDTAVLACKKGGISLLAGRLYIIYRELKIDFFNWGRNLIGSKYYKAKLPKQNTS